MAFRAIERVAPALRTADLGIFGCGGSNVTPMDTPTEFEEEELLAVLERGHAAVADAPRRLMICHTPPYAHAPGPPDERHPRGQPGGAVLHRVAESARVR